MSFTLRLTRLRESVAASAVAMAFVAASPLTVPNSLAAPDRLYHIMQVLHLRTVIDESHIGVRLPGLP